MYNRSRRVYNAGDRKLEVALHEARIIQQQKDCEAKIVNSIEELLELPTSAEAEPQAPSVPDARHFLTLVTLFQSNHYDDLVEERQAAGLCGYVLCPRPPRRVDSDYRIIKGSGRGEVNIVPKHEIERWCSDDCARRALHVRAQLDEEPPWTRPAGKDVSIGLLSTGVASLSSRSVSSKALQNNGTVSHGELTSITKSMADLAMERGDSAMPWTSRRTLSSSIKERYRNENQPTVSK